MCESQVEWSISDHSPNSAYLIDHSKISCKDLFGLLAILSLLSKMYSNFFTFCFCFFRSLCFVLCCPILISHCRHLLSSKDSLFFLPIDFQLLLLLLFFPYIFFFLFLLLLLLLLLLLFFLLFDNQKY